MEIVTRFKDETDVLFLLIETDMLMSPLKFEAAKSGRAGLFPHIYGPLNLDAVYQVLEVQRDQNNDFIAPPALSALIAK